MAVAVGRDIHGILGRRLLDRPWPLVPRLGALHGWTSKKHAHEECL
jgi:hypothetical protein